MSDMGGGGRKRGGLLDDLAGVAGGAFSALAGLRAEVEAMARSQVEAMVQRLDLVRRDDLDAAMEVARRAREAQEGLEARVAALEARLAASPTPAAAPVAATPVPPPGDAAPMGAIPERDDGAPIGPAIGPPSGPAGGGTPGAGTGLA